MGQFPSGHPPRGELGDAIVEADAADPYHVHLIGGVVEGSVQGPIVAYR